MSTVRGLSIPARRNVRTALFLGEIQGLPGLGPTAARLVAWAFDDEKEPSALESAVLSNPWQSSKLAQAAVGPRDKADGENRFADLGTDEVCSAAIAIELDRWIQRLPKTTSCELDRAEFTRHSFAVAVAAMSLADGAGDHPLALPAFVCGLLHDVGKIALDACLPKSYARVIRQTRSRNQCICDAEQALLGVDHTVIGKRLLAHWDLPLEAQQCAWLHHQPPDVFATTVRLPRLAQLVHLADNLVRRRQIGYSGYHHVNTTAQESLNLSDTTLSQVDRAIIDRLERIEQFVKPRAASAPGSREANSVRTSRAPDSSTESDRRPNATTIQQHTRQFAGFAHLAKSLRVHEGIADLCRQMAEAVCLGLQTPAAIAFAIPPHSLMCHVAVRTSDRSIAETLPLRSAGILDSDIRPFEHASAGRWVAAKPAFVSSIEERHARLLMGADLRMLPVLHDGHLSGGVLTADPCGRIGQASQTGDDFDSLCTAFAWALASSFAKSESLELAENLADLNRRMHLGQLDRIQATSLNILARMAAGAAHELNNPLAVIAGRAQMLRNDITDQNLARHLEIIDEQSHRASQIVSELMCFAKPEPPAPRPMSVPHWAKRLQRRWLEQSNLGADSITISISDTALRMFVDAGQIDEAADAIMANAVEATTPENARLVVHSRSVASDDTVVVSIGDNGHGMPTDVLKHACDPFFSYRPAGRGRGLGLSRAARLLEINDGRLWIDSFPGSGTTVFLAMPARESWSE